MTRSGPTSGRREGPLEGYGKDPEDQLRSEIDSDSLPTRLDRLTEAIEGLMLEVEGISERLDRLEASRSRRSGAGSTRGRRRSTSPRESVEVIVRPVTELAMVAVAERALRQAEGVESVIRSDGAGDEGRSARYLLEVMQGADLPGEVGKTLPVPFRATEEEAGVIAFDLEW
jgi:hypothetical protein